MKIFDRILQARKSHDTRAVILESMVTSAITMTNGRCKDDLDLISPHRYQNAPPKAGMSRNCSLTSYGSGNFVKIHEDHNCGGAEAEAEAEGSQLSCWSVRATDGFAVKYMGLARPVSPCTRFLDGKAVDVEMEDGITND